MDEEKKDKANPFSFKTFMKRASTDVSAATEQSGPSQEKSGIKNVKASKKKKESSKKAGSGENIFSDSPEEEDNPFSFTKFVKTKGSKKQSQSTIPPVFEDTSSDDDLFSDPSPPQNNMPLTATKPRPTGTQTTKEKKAKTKNDPLMREDIFESDSDSSFGMTEEDSLLFKKSSDVPIELGPPLASVPTTQTVSNGPRGMAIPLTGGDSMNRESDSLGSSLEGPEEALPALSGLPTLPGEMTEGGALVKKLKAENNKLKSELEKSRRETKKQKEINVSLREEVKALKKKESEDTKALEDMVQKVESNLVATTKRAVSAEATIAKLTQEIQSLKIQLAQTTPQSVHQKYEEILRGVREKASFASMQLTTASQKAEQSIKELMSGAETLRNVSEILLFIDSFTEVKEQPKT